MDDFFRSIIEDINEEELSLKFKVGQFDPQLIKISTDQTPFFAYDYLNFKIEEFSFHHLDFLHEDYKIYFSQVKKISKIPLNDLINYHKHSEHFHISPPNSRMRELLKEIFNKSRLRPEETPDVGQFHLYTPNDGSNKAPRIHFFVGPLAVFYIILYDPYHQIYPIKKV
ncbi:hypothetical protein ACTJJ0_15750 [Chitinophaga sp. 22321]|uniref:Uncharacterized protein n=1 Tax=Chitinophaga hostae TaxID=2831022 RepID=A0ABS5J2L1_9BACT|nr:hypothetical protein [Chitinophaga hostae]MBS0029471.1 hypothetical protein [Chitinophaga hostae]